MLSIPYQPHNILVTGGAGFIGSNFIGYLLRHYPEVYVYNYDALTYAGSLNNLENLSDISHYIFIKGDICDARLIAKVLQEHAIDTILHFAAESHVDRSIQGPAPFIQTNVMGTFTLLEAARQQWLIKNKWDGTQCRFHHISTDEVFGSLQREESPFTELTAYAPNSPYAASKAAADHLVRSYAHTYGLPITLSNCSNNYGPYQHAEKLIPTIIRCCLTGQPIPLYGDGSNVRDWLYVEDHCVGINYILMKGKEGESYNLGGNNERSNIEVAEQICSLMDEYSPRYAPHRRLIHFVTDRPGHDWRYAVDSKKIFTELGWQPAETFATGVRKTVEFYYSRR